MAINRNNRFNNVARYWDKQMPMMVMEEAGELIQAISKVERSGSVEERSRFSANYKIADETVRKALVDELGDIFIAAQALMRHYSITKAEVDERIEEKLNKEYKKTI